LIVNFELARSVTFFLLCVVAFGVCGLPTSLGLAAFQLRDLVRSFEKGKEERLLTRIIPCLAMNVISNLENPVTIAD
jgi:hypothetical protein